MAQFVEPCKPDFDMARLWEAWRTLRHWAMGEMKVHYDDPEKRRHLKPEIIWEIEGGDGVSAAQISSAAIARSQWFSTLVDLFRGIRFSSCCLQRRCFRFPLKPRGRQFH